MSERSERRLAYTRAQLDRGSATPGGDGPLTFTASTNRLNRKGYSLRTDGWRLENFNANPVVLWMHNPFEPPIGTGVAANKGNRIAADVTFDREDEFARTVDSKYRRGFLSAVSVSLDFLDEDGQQLNYWLMSAEQIRDDAFYDLVEISAVTTPADPGALIEHQRAALSALFGPALADLVGAQHSARTDPQSTITADQLAAAVAAELERLGIEIPSKAPEPTAAGIDTDAARAVLAAFARSEEH